MFYCILIQFILCLFVIQAYRTLQARMATLEKQLYSVPADSTSEGCRIIKKLRDILLWREFVSSLGSQGLEIPLALKYHLPTPVTFPNVISMLKWTATLSSKTAEEQLHLVSLLYYYEMLFSLSHSHFATDHQTLRERLLGGTYRDVPITEVRIPERGSVIDLAWMYPRTEPAGYRVKQPLSVALFSDQSLIIKASVIGE